MGTSNTVTDIHKYDTAEVLNRELLKQYRQLKVGLLDRLIAAYLDEAPVYFAKIRDAVQSENFDDIVWGSHSLKSCSGNLGAVRLSHVCQLMENADELYRRHYNYGTARLSDHHANSRGRWIIWPS